VNRNPEIECITTKDGLDETLKWRKRCLDDTSLSADQRATSISLSQFYSPTFKLNDTRDRQEFLAFTETLGSDQIWICKPTSMNCGRGIYLIPDIAKFKEQLEEADARARNGGRPQQKQLVQL